MTPRRNKPAPSANAPKLDRLPPHSIEAERGVLGCLLLDPATSFDKTEAALGRAGAAAFYDARHQLVYAAMLAVQRDTQTLDLVLLQERLRTDGDLDKVGGLGQLSALMDDVPSAENLEYYLGIVRGKYQLRRLLFLGADLCGRVYDHEGEVEALLTVAARELESLIDDDMAKPEVTLAVAAAEAMDELADHYSRGKLNMPPGFLPTGLDYLDKVLGGIDPNYYTVIAGRPAAGKTTFAMQLIAHLAGDYLPPPPKDATQEEIDALTPGIPVGVFSLEMSRKSLAKRLLFWAARVSSGKFKQGFAAKGDIVNLVKAQQTLSKLNVWLDDTAAQTIASIETKARRMVRQHGVKVLFLDYLQLVQPASRIGRIDRVQELTDISARFVAMVKRLGVPWIVLAQMNRNIETAESHRVPMLSDLRDCGAIEQDAGQVLFLYQPAKPQRHVDSKGVAHPDKRAKEEDLVAKHFANVERSEWPLRINAFVAKNRDGATGVAELLFYRNQFRFEDWRQWRNLVTGDYGTGERSSANPLEQRGLIDPDDVPQ